MALTLLSEAGPSQTNRASRLWCSSQKILYPPTPSPSRSAFSTSARCSATPTRKGHTHYETLGIAPGSSRMEIKAAYFRLSKKYHPDVRRSKDGAADATEQFHEVSAAYAVLSDDRQRRAYDRTMVSPESSARSRAHTPGSSSSPSHIYEMHAHRRRGATHAWEGGPRGYKGRTHPQYARGGPSTAHGHEHNTSGRHYDPSTSPFSNPSSSSTNTPPGGYGIRVDDRLTGRAARAEEEHRARDRIVRESNVGRFLRALGIIVVVSWIGGLGGSFRGS